MLKPAATRVITAKMKMRETSRLSSHRPLASLRLQCTNSIRTCPRNCWRSWSCRTFASRTCRWKSTRLNNKTKPSKQRLVSKRVWVNKFKLSVSRTKNLDTWWLPSRVSLLRAWSRCAVRLGPWWMHSKFYLSSKTRLKCRCPTVNSCCRHSSPPELLSIEAKWLTLMNWKKEGVRQTVKSSLMEAKHWCWGDSLQQQSWPATWW